ncbi:hypothetical protein EVAR_2459_1 [Eumeta japonica]|uniref:Uncharacterized protein n=1 Tax=Eumeta variegata TaxID=151549 RepID=A0A4C1SRQ8_EUMVA|nr:hypothetical protein EVAR_2459_1 [Eumeta japonica]
MTGVRQEHVTRNLINPRVHGCSRLEDIYIGTIITVAPSAPGPDTRPPISPAARRPLIRILRGFPSRRYGQTSAYAPFSGQPAAGGARGAGGTRGRNVLISLRVTGHVHPSPGPPQSRPPRRCHRHCLHNN